MSRGVQYSILKGRFTKKIRRVFVSPNPLFQTCGVTKPMKIQCFFQGIQNDLVCPQAVRFRFLGVSSFWPVTPRPDLWRARISHNKSGEYFLSTEPPLFACVLGVACCLLD